MFMFKTLFTKKRSKSLTPQEDEEKITYPEKIARELYDTLNLVGCNPTDRSSRQNMIWYFHFCCQVYWCGALFSYNICCYHGKPDFIEHIMYTAIAVQVIIKFVICRVYSSNLTGILNNLFRTFWTDEDIVEQGRESYIKLNIALHKVVIIYKKLFYYAIAVILIETQVSTPMRPIFTIWTPKSFDLNNDYGIWVYIAQILSIATCVVFALVPLDSIFILMVGSAYIQFDCLITTMKYLDCSNRDKAYTTLMKCVEHHNRVLVYLKNVEQVYTLSLLSQLCAILSTVCICIYIASLDITLAVRPFLYATLSAAQLFIYCLGGEMITEQGMALADAAYESDWWNLPDKAFRGGLVLMIQRAQRPIKISAGNVFILSIELFTKVLKASVSFMTMLSNSTKQS